MTKIKELAKCKHPNSRKTNALIKQIKKAKSREKNKQNTSLKFNILGEKIAWFRDNLEPECNCYTPKQCLDLINKYLLRFNDELEQIRLKHSIGNRKNRQHASREDAINMTIKNEAEEFNTCGLEIPDLLNVSQFKILKTWNGELRYLTNFKLKRYSRKLLEEEERKMQEELLKSATPQNFVKTNNPKSEMSVVNNEDCNMEHSPL